MILNNKITSGMWGFVESSNTVIIEVQFLNIDLCNNGPAALVIVLLSTTTLL